MLPLSMLVYVLLLLLLRVLQFILLRLLQQLLLLRMQTCRVRQNILSRQSVRATTDACDGSPPASSAVALDAGSDAHEELAVEGDPEDDPTEDEATSSRARDPRQVRDARERRLPEDSDVAAVVWVLGTAARLCEFDTLDSLVKASSTASAAWSARTWARSSRFLRPAVSSPAAVAALNSTSNLISSSTAALSICFSTPQSATDEPDPAAASGNFLTSSSNTLVSAAIAQDRD
eukprot:GHVU01039771.1.p1 GENE.GHVU01039771.1~~GHVU01039771.1.p1  ORF type:complete len:233 (-),score=28.89 GHVU01039771.1:312-1010(-)